MGAAGVRQRQRSQRRRRAGAPIVAANVMIGFRCGSGPDSVGTGRGAAGWHGSVHQLSSGFVVFQLLSSGICGSQACWTPVRTSAFFGT
jgi:hypothetical protein